jgi:hypothetical protein
VALVLVAHHWWLIRSRKREDCFRAFRYSHWIGAPCSPGSRAWCSRDELQPTCGISSASSSRSASERVGGAVSPRLEMTEFCDRMLKQGGPALLFEKPAGHSMPVLGNLFGTVRRVALAMGAESELALREIGKLLAALREPEAPRGLRDCGSGFRAAPVLSKVMDMAPKELSSAPCQEIVWEGADVDLGGCRCRRAGPTMRAAAHLGTDRHARAAESRARTSASIASR